MPQRRVLIRAAGRRAAVHLWPGGRAASRRRRQSGERRRGRPHRPPICGAAWAVASNRPRGRRAGPARPVPGAGPGGGPAPSRQLTSATNAPRASPSPTRPSSDVTAAPGVSMSSALTKRGGARGRLFVVHVFRHDDTLRRVLVCVVVDFMGEGCEVNVLPTPGTVQWVNAEHVSSGRYW